MAVAKEHGIHTDDMNDTATVSPPISIARESDVGDTVGVAAKIAAEIAAPHRGGHGQEEDRAHIGRCHDQDGQRGTRRQHWSRPTSHRRHPTLYCDCLPRSIPTPAAWKYHVTVVDVAWDVVDVCMADVDALGCEPVPELSRHVNEDEHGRGVLCFECGQQYRGDCEETLSRHGSCLTCRAPFFVTAEVIERLLQLVARAPGRHTPMAQNIVGGMYENNQGLETWLPKDLTKAARLYRLAVNQGYANAQCNLGVMFENGAGVPQDFKQAAR